jgi:hypothetical protein
LPFGFCSMLFILSMCFYAERPGSPSGLLANFAAELENLRHLRR